MSEIKPVYQVKRFDETGWADVTQESYKNCELAQTILETRILYPAADYEVLRKENEALIQKLETAAFNHFAAQERIEAQAKRIAELEEHVTKLGSGSRQHLYQAFARRYKEILSLRRENEALKEKLERLNGLYHAEVSKHQLDYNALKAENEELKEDLQFVERWANHHAAHPNITAQEALSVIQHHPSIEEITKSYKDGVIPKTRNPYTEIEALRKQSDEMLAAMRRAVLALAFAAESSKAMQDDYQALSNAIDRAVESKNGDSK